MNRKSTLLIVDDSKIARMMIHAFIKEKHPDWGVLEAGSGDGALEIAENTTIDYCSIDFNMPGMDGVELMEKIAANYPATKKVLMTANYQDEIISRVVALDSIVIAKPITEQSVSQMLGYFNE